jgi:hypothetical protein
MKTSRSGELTVVMNPIEKKHREQKIVMRDEMSVASDVVTGELTGKCVSKTSHGYDNQEAFHAPLHPLDTEKQTFGCRHTRPDCCLKNSLPNICAFVRKDNVCLSPPQSWKKQFAKLRANAKSSTDIAVAPIKPVSVK